MEYENRIPIEHFADFVRCTLYRDPAQPELGTTASLRYDAAMEAMAQHLAEKVKLHKAGKCHEDDVWAYLVDSAEYERNLNELVPPRQHYLGLIFPRVVWRNGVGMPVEMVPPSLRVKMGFHPEVA